MLEHRKTLTTHHHEVQQSRGIARRDKGHWEKGAWVLIVVRHPRWVCTALPLPWARLQAIQAEVARQLAGFDQRAQVQDAEILRLRREPDEAARREQEMKEHVRREREVANNAPLPRVAQPLTGFPATGHSGTRANHASG